MRILVLGGSEFVGRAVVEEALGRGWDVTVANRGTRPASQGVAQRVVDRRSGPIGDGEWDLVVDTWSTEPLPVLRAAEELRDRVGRYSYISTRSVYESAAAGSNEEAPVVDTRPDDTDGSDYARAKRGGELAVLQGFGPGRTTITRPGCIVGPWENTGRLLWWLERMSRGGDVLAPAPADASVQYIDARDLAIFALDAEPGIYDTVTTTTMGALLEQCVDTAGPDARLAWREPSAILGAGIRPWIDLPFWLPPGPDADALHGADTSRAVAAGLATRPLADTVAQTWEWMRSTDERIERRRVGLDPALEARVLAER